MAMAMAMATTMAPPDETPRSDLRPRPGRARAFGAALVALALLAPGPARAQTREELDRARVLFKEGVALSAANNCAAALTKFQAVANVKMTAQVAFNIAECEERLGKLVSALGNFRVAASMAEGDAKAKDVSAQVGNRIEALEARVPKLTLKRGKGAATASIELDGSDLGTGQISGEIPVDPGAHTIVAKIGGKEASHETVTLADKESKTFEVTVDLPPAKVEDHDSGPVELGPDEPQQPSPSRVPGAVALGVGGASIVVGAVFWGLRGGTLGELEQRCGGDLSCPPSAAPVADKGRLYTGVAEVAAGVGIAGVIAGIVLLVKSAPPSPPKQAGARAATRTTTFSLTPTAPRASLGGLSIEGTF